KDRRFAERTKRLPWFPYSETPLHISLRHEKLAFRGQEMAKVEKAPRQPACRMQKLNVRRR
ncbi:MAG: hypothetical protein ACK4NV_15370, partial [Pannonibacter sp.]